MLRAVKILFAAIVIVSLMGDAAYAKAPYPGYNYDDRLETIPSLQGYEPEKMLTGRDFGMDDLKSPMDMMFDKEGKLYIADTGNNRIVILNKDFKVDRIIREFDNEGSEDTFNAPEGVFVDDSGSIYIADTKNSRLVRLDGEGKLIKIFPKPKSEILPDNFKYNPQKLVVDKVGRIYVVAQGVLEGLMQLDHNGEFNRFFGSNRVKANPFEILFRKLLSPTQREKRKLNLPIEYSNAYIDPQGFLYTTTRNVDLNQVKRLNSMGDNIIRHDGRVRNKYGDILWGAIRPQFMDVQVDEYGNVIALDNSRGRVYKYNSLGDLLFVFGGLGEHVGLFKNAVALEMRDEKVFVLEETQGTITVFKMTEFGKLVMTANNLYMDGKYLEAQEPWNEVLKRNSNYDLAYIGIGNALHKQEKYREAMRYFKLGYSRFNYSRSFKEYRTEVMRAYFSEIVLGFVIVMLLLKLLGKFMKSKIKALRRREYLGNNI
jgi:sugar lactone lactonase YvrE